MGKGSWLKYSLGSMERKDFVDRVEELNRQKRKWALTCTVGGNTDIVMRYYFVAEFFVLVFKDKKKSELVASIDFDDITDVY